MFTGTEIVTDFQPYFKNSPWLGMSLGRFYYCHFKGEPHDRQVAWDTIWDLPYGTLCWTANSRAMCCLLFGMRTQDLPKIKPWPSPMGLVEEERVVALLYTELKGGDEDISIQRWFIVVQERSQRRS